MITADAFASRLRALDGSALVHFVRVAAGDPRIDWSSFPEPTPCALPSLDYGQLEDLRYSVSGVSLHEHRYRDRSVWHLDLVDACEAPIRHLIADTDAPVRALLGAGAGVGVALLARRRPRWVAAAGVAGAAIGMMSAGARGRIIEIDFDRLLASCDHGQ